MGRVKVEDGYPVVAACESRWPDWRELGYAVLASRGRQWTTHARTSSDSDHPRLIDFVFVVLKARELHAARLQLGGRPEEETARIESLFSETSRWAVTQLP